MPKQVTRAAPTANGRRTPAARSGEAAALRRALAAVDAIAAQVARTPTLAELLPVALRTAVEAVGADAGIIRLLEGDGTALALAAAVGLPDEYLARHGRVAVDEGTLSGRAIRREQVQSVSAGDELPGVSEIPRRLGFQSVLSAPLLADGRPLGVVGFASRRPAGFTRDDHQLLGVIAHHLATAVVRARLFDTVAAAKAEWQSTFDAMPDGVALCLPVERLKRTNQAFAALFGCHPRALAGAPCPLGIPHPIEGEIGREIDGPLAGRRLLINTLPLRHGQVEPGTVLHIVHDVTAERAAAAALRQQNVLLEEAGAEAEMFGAIAHSIATSLHLEDVLDRIVEAGRRVAGVDFCDISLPDPAERWLAIAAMSGGLPLGAGDVRIPLDQPYPGAAAWRQRRTVLVEHFAAHPEFLRDVADRFHVRAGLFVPLLGSQGPVGVLVFAHTEPHKAFHPDTVRRAERLAAHAALALENARLHRELAEHAAHLEQRVRERTEALEAASRHKSDFLAHMSHELRTPLNAILGFSGMLLQGHGGTLTEKGNRYVAQVQASGQHLLALINEVLDLAKVEAGRLELHREPVSVGAALAGAVGLVKGMAAARGVTVREEPVELDLVVQADAMRLQQVMTNLLSNAIKFTPSGGRMTVRASRAAGAGAGGEGGPSAAGRWVQIVVSDTGVGIRPEDLGRLFQPFEQLANHSRRSHEGTGLGLALARRLVELHGGSIQAESPGLGQGSTITVTLPLDGGIARRTVAVVEDDPLMREMVVAALEGAGHRTLAAGTAAEGAALLARAPDLLILDLNLPDRSGREILADLRADPATRDLPVLMISGFPDVTEAELRGAGADEFLTKPFSHTVLVDTVARLLARRPWADADAPKPHSNAVHGVECHPQEGER